MHKVDDLLKALASAPPGPHAQIDESLTPKLTALVGKPAAEQATGLKEILDLAAHAGLASGFAMTAMDMVWKLARVNAGESESILN